MTPTCPSNYHCKFDPIKPGYHWAHWWDGPWGIVVAVAIVVAVTIMVCTIAYQWKEIRDNRARYVATKEDRANKLAIEEQRTMQLDAAKGNPDMLKIVRDMQR